MLYSTPRLPNAGGRITAEFGRNLIRSVRSAMPVASPGMLISRGTYGTSMIPIAEAKARQTVGAVRPLTPFAVRWFPKSSDDPKLGEWQIYLPFGSMFVEYGNTRRYAGLPTNEKATNEDNTPIFQWYKVAANTDLKDKDALIETINGRINKSWKVIVLTKPWARFLVSTDPTANDPVAWADVVATIGVAEWEEEGEDGEVATVVEHNVTSIVSEPLTKAWDNRSAFAVDYQLADETETGSNYTASVVHQIKMLGRLQVSNLQPVNVKTATEVWIKINHAGENFTLQVLAEAPQDTKSNDDQTVYKIYDMQNGVVTADYRATIPELPFYTSAPQQGSNS